MVDAYQVFEESSENAIEQELYLYPLLDISSCIKHGMTRFHRKEKKLFFFTYYFCSFDEYFLHFVNGIGSMSDR